MPRFFLPLFLVVGGACLCGCGGSDVVVQGTITLDGQPYAVSKDEQMMVLFLDMKEEGQVTQKTFPATVRPDGTFTVQAPNNQGIPAGKYRVAVSSTPMVPKPGVPVKDLFKNTYNAKTSPLVVEISSSARKPVLELKSAK